MRARAAPPSTVPSNVTMLVRHKENKHGMKFFLDTANIQEIRDAASTGILDGITTNPTLISKEGNSFEDQLLKSARW